MTTLTLIAIGSTAIAVALLVWLAFEFGCLVTAVRMTAEVSRLEERVRELTRQIRRTKA